MEYCINCEFLLNKHLYSIYLFCFVQCNFLMQYSMHFQQCKYIVIIFIAISHEPVLYSVYLSKKYKNNTIIYNFSWYYIFLSMFIIWSSLLQSLNSNIYQIFQFMIGFNLIHIIILHYHVHSNSAISFTFTQE